MSNDRHWVPSHTSHAGEVRNRVIESNIDAGSVGDASPEGFLLFSNLDPRNGQYTEAITNFQGDNFTPVALPNLGPEWASSSSVDLDITHNPPIAPSHNRPHHEQQHHYHHHHQYTNTSHPVNLSPSQSHQYPSVPSQGLENALGGGFTEQGAFFGRGIKFTRGRTGTVVGYRPRMETVNPAAEQNALNAYAPFVADWSAGLPGTIGSSTTTTTSSSTSALNTDTYSTSPSMLISPPNPILAGFPMRNREVGPRTPIDAPAQSSMDGTAALGSTERIEGRSITPSLLFGASIASSSRREQNVAGSSMSRSVSASDSSSSTMGISTPRPTVVPPLLSRKRSFQSRSSSGTKSPISTAAKNISTSSSSTKPSPTQAISASAASLFHSKPFRCPQPGCLKSYKQANGLKYHISHGSCSYTLPSNMPSLEGLSEEEFERHLKPFCCQVAPCQRRYKNMNGLRYHYQHSGEHGAQGLALLASGNHNAMKEPVAPPKISLDTSGVDFKKFSSSSSSTASPNRTKSSSPATTEFSSSSSSTASPNRAKSSSPATTVASSFSPITPDDVKAAGSQGNQNHLAHNLEGHYGLGSLAFVSSPLSAHARSRLHALTMPAPVPVPLYSTVSPIGNISSQGQWMSQPPSAYASRWASPRTDNLPTVADATGGAVPTTSMTYNQSSQMHGQGWQHMHEDMDMAQ